MAKVIGLTGGIASGKSTARRFFMDQGIPTIDADALAREVVEPGQAGLNAIQKTFGTDYLLPNGQLNREKLGSLVFSQPAEKARLDSQLGPIIRKELLRQITAAKKETVPLVIVDIPLLFENNYQPELDGVLVITVKPELQSQRLMKRNGLTEIEAAQRIAAQWPLAEKVAIADWVISNDLDEQALDDQLENWLKQRLT